MTVLLPALLSIDVLLLAVPERLREGRSLLAWGF